MNRLRIKMAILSNAGGSQFWGLVNRTIINPTRVITMGDHQGLFSVEATATPSVQLAWGPALPLVGFCGTIIIKRDRPGGKAVSRHASSSPLPCTRGRGVGGEGESTKPP